MTLESNAHAVAPYRGLDAVQFAHWESVARDVASQLAGTALARDRANLDPKAEIALLRDAGLLRLATPVEFGGAGANLLQALRIGQIVSAADGSIGQLLLYHYSNGVWSHILGTPAQWAQVARGVGEKGWFQGGVSNPRDPKTDIAERNGKLYLSGTRTFATGASIANVLTVSVWQGERLIHLQVAADRQGLRYEGDWDNLGQRLTASGSVVFSDVEVDLSERLAGLDEWPGGVEGAARRDGLRSQFSQLIFVYLYLGIAEGALEAAGHYVRTAGRPWPESGLADAGQDPYHLQLLGRLSAGVAAGIALADSAAVQYQAALEKGPALTAQEWGELALRISQAKSVASEISVETSTQIFQATGARSTANRHGLDIFWRNVRTHSVHDPLPYRQREVGQYVINRVLPKPRVFVPPKA
jgi:alkylation response protein AidB-like acyl-CoA dehydrogenase